MEETYIGKIYNVCEWIARLTYLNILWIFFTFFGLILFGLVPSTIAMFSVTRKWTMGNKDIKLFSTFWKVYRAEFKKVQPYSMGLFLIAIIFAVNYKYYINGSIEVVFPLPLIVAGLFFIYIVFLLFIFPIYVHYQFRPLEYLNNCLLMVISYPLYGFLMICGVLFMGLFVLNFPGLSPFISGSVLAYWLTFIAHQMFFKMEQKIKLSGEDRV